MIGITNDKYKEEYFDKQNNFNLFDFASYDKNRNIVIHGRLDDTINIRAIELVLVKLKQKLLKSKILKKLCYFCA